MAQIECIFDDISVDSVKIGMVSSIDIINIIADILKSKNAKNIVLDPVMVSKSDCHLLRTESREVLVKKLFPIALVVTPNLFEAEVITDDKIETLEEMEKAAIKIFNLGAKNVMVKGGHLSGDAIDVLYDGSSSHHIKGERINNLAIVTIFVGVLVATWAHTTDKGIHVVNNVAVVLLGGLCLLLLGLVFKSGHPQPILSTISIGAALELSIIMIYH